MKIPWPGTFISHWLVLLSWKGFNWHLDEIIQQFQIWKKASFIVWEIHLWFLDAFRMKIENDLLQQKLFWIICALFVHQKPGMQSTRYQKAEQNLLLFLFLFNFLKNFQNKFPFLSKNKKFQKKCQTFLKNNKLPIISIKNKAFEKKTRVPKKLLEKFIILCLKNWKIGYKSLKLKWKSGCTGIQTHYLRCYIIALTPNTCIKQTVNDSAARSGVEVCASWAVSRKGKLFNYWFEYFPETFLKENIKRKKTKIAVSCLCRT